MLRKFITLCLFTTAVPFAVFGQDIFGGEHVRSLLSTMPHNIRAHWPEARKQIEEKLPGAMESIATSLNDYNPSAGGPDTTLCPVNNGLWYKHVAAKNSVNHFSI